MESLGKSVRVDGSAVGNVTGPVIWGGVGSSTQHSFFKSLHQGTDTVLPDFIGVVHQAHTLAWHHHELLANLLAQTHVFACSEENERSDNRRVGKALCRTSRCRGSTDHAE